MDVFLIKDGVIFNIVVVESVAQAEALYNMQAVQRTPENQHLQVGDPAP
jgi:hypothetical protein